jgi:hypothetical protein
VKRKKKQRRISVKKTEGEEDIQNGKKREHFFGYGSIFFLANLVVVFSLLFLCRYKFVLWILLHFWMGNEFSSLQTEMIGVPERKKSRRIVVA